MTPEQRLLEQLRSALAEADTDVQPLIDRAVADARAEVADTLRRLVSQDLLRRTLDVLGHGPEAAPRGRRRSPVDGDEGRERAPTTQAPPAASTGSPTPPATHATYLFGVTPAGALHLDDLGAMPGGGEVRTLAGEHVQAVVCDVDPTAFEVLAAPGAEGLDTLAAVAHAHDATLASLAVQTTVLPLPLGTVLSDDAAVAALVQEHEERLVGELRRFAGTAEWAVRVHLLEDAEPGDTAAREATSGSDYLRRRSVALEEQRTRWSARETLATGLHERFATCALRADVVVSRPVEDVAPPLLHGVYLLGADGLEDLERTVEAVRSELDDAVVEVTGPWPPYHFADLDLGADAGGAP